MSSPKNQDRARPPGSDPASSSEPAPDDFFPEDERSPAEKEDDHSFTDFDLPAEIEAAAAKARREKPGAPPLADGGGNLSDLYFPEDERTPPDLEDDHSLTDFDLNAEIEARLGQAPPEEAASPEPPLPPLEETFAPDGDYFPEDERAPMDSEDDHSFTDFELNPGASRAPANAGPPETAQGEDSPDDYFPEDERSSIDIEEDFSQPDIDLDAEIEAKLGPAEDPDLRKAVEEGHVHPGLAASLQSSFTYALRGVQDEPGDDDVAPPRDEAARNLEGLGVEDDSPSPPEPEDSGDDGLSPLPPGTAAEDDPFAALDNPEPLPARAPLRDGNGSGGEQGEDNDIPPADGEESEDDDLPTDEEDDEGDGEDTPMTLRDHLLELRKRVFRAFLWAVVGFFFCYPFAEQIFNLLVAPLRAALPDASHFIFTSPPEAFFTFLKVALVAGFFAACPMIFYQVWAFVAPGLYREEKLYLLPLVFFSALFFLCGGAFCYFIALPFAFEFFMSYNTELIKALPKLSETLSFVLQLIVAFGLVFEMPLFVFFLSRLGIITADMMRRFRRYAVLCNVILAAILTPPDVMSQMLMAGPLLLLYELSILIAAVFGKKKQLEPEEEDEDKEENEEEDEDENDDGSARDGHKQLT